MAAKAYRNASSNSKRVTRLRPDPPDWLTTPLGVVIQIGGARSTRRTVVHACPSCRWERCRTFKGNRQLFFYVADRDQPTPPPDFCAGCERWLSARWFSKGKPSAPPRPPGAAGPRGARRSVRAPVIQRAVPRR
jgi:hypothetical protein